LPEQIKDRDADVWEPLIAVADAAGGRWPDLARVTAVTLVTQSRERDASLGLRLLSDLRTVWGDAVSRPTEWILTELLALEESPWGDLKGKPLDSRGLAFRLRRYDIKPKVIRTDNQTTIRGYHINDLSDAWQRYLPVVASLPRTSETSVTSETTCRACDGSGCPTCKPEQFGLPWKHRGAV
jgi:hypothetical protein